MVKKRKLFQKILAGSKNIRFEDFVLLLEAFGFILRRTKGSHYVYRHAKIAKPFPVQEQSNGQAKPYQIQQFLKLVEQYELTLDEPSEDTE